MGASKQPAHRAVVLSLEARLRSWAPISVSSTESEPEFSWREEPYPVAKTVLVFGVHPKTKIPEILRRLADAASTVPSSGADGVDGE